MQEEISRRLDDPQAPWRFTIEKGDPLNHPKTFIVRDTRNGSVVRTKHGKPKEDCSVSLWKEIGRTDLKGSHGPQH